RIADEIHVILGILDQHLEATVPAPVLHPNEVPGLSEDLQLRAQQEGAGERAHVWRTFRPVNYCEQEVFRKNAAFKSTTLLFKTLSLLF
ncbi:unnamed protein product, partial [Durusdinium trenchii]